MTFALEPVPEGTRLTVEHKGFQGAKGLMVSLILRRGWNKKILRVGLPRLLTRLAEADQGRDRGGQGARDDPRESLGGRHDEDLQG